MSYSPAKYSISHYQTWRIFVEDTGPLVIMSFSWVASHLPRPTTKQGLFISKFTIKRTEHSFALNVLPVLPFWYTVRKKKHHFSVTT
jgi:hypothetical protein